MIKNLKYLLRSKKVLVIFFYVLHLAVTVTPFLASQAKDRAIPLSYSLVLNALLSLVMTYLLPILLFSFVQRKRSVDSYLALPVSRKDLLLSNLLFAFLLPACCSTLNALIAALLAGPCFHFPSFLLLFAEGMITIAVMVILNTCFYLLANNIFDGVVMIAAYTAMPFAVVGLIVLFGEIFVYGYNPLDNSRMYWFSPLYMLGYNFFVQTEAISNANIPFDGMYLLLPVLYAVLAAFGLRKHFIDRKSERAEQISNEFFAYPFVIHFYVLACLCMLTFVVSNEPGEIGEWIIVYLLIFLAFMIATFVYKRRIKVEPKSLIVFAAGILLASLLGFAANATNGFGLSYAYDKNPRNVLYNYNSYVYDGDFGIRSKELPAYWRGRDDLFFSVSFELPIPAEKMDEYAEVRELLEGVRAEAIRNHYEDHEEGVFGFLNVYNGFNEQTRDGSLMRFPVEQSYGYGIRYLTLEELKQISRYTPVYVDVWSNQGYDPEHPDDYIELHLTLDQFLNYKGK